MSQPSTITLANQSGASYRSLHNQINQGFASSHMGSSEPSYVVSGMTWMDNTGTPWLHKLYDGTASWVFAEYYTSTDKIILKNVGNGDARDESSNIGQIQDSDFTWLGTLSGTTTLTATLTPTLSAYKNGQIFVGKAGNNASGASTLNVDGLGAKTIWLEQGNVTSGAWMANDLLMFIYDGTQFQLYGPARTAAGVGAALLNAAQTFQGGQRVSSTSLTSTSNSIAINLNLNNDFSHTTTENTTLANPTNIASAVGQKGVIIITQGATPRTLAFGNQYKFSGGVAPNLTSTAGAVDRLDYHVVSATVVHVSLGGDYK